MAIIKSKPLSIDIQMLNDPKNASACSVIYRLAWYLSETDATAQIYEVTINYRAEGNRYVFNDIVLLNVELVADLTNGGFTYNVELVDRGEMDNNHMGYFDGLIAPQTDAYKKAKRDWNDDVLDYNSISDIDYDPFERGRNGDNFSENLSLNPYSKSPLQRLIDNEDED